MAKAKHGAYKIILFIVVLLLVVVATAWFLSGKNIAILNTAGPIASQERGLIIFASALSLLVVIPVFALTFYIAWKYRASNKKARYEPNWDSHVGIEALWWGIPLALIVVLSIVTWVSSHTLDPYRPLESDVKPLKIQVVSLQWKWLFIYPEQNIATVNYVQFPEDRPIEFTLTSDAPMNSFWIPQLGSQIYTMTGMSTRLYLQADNPGTYHGSSANISGEGFSDMAFTAKSSTQADFDAWVQDVRTSPDTLGKDTYTKLAEPSRHNSVAYYSSVEHNLYSTIVEQYMSGMPHGMSTSTMDMEHH